MSDLPKGKRIVQDEGATRRRTLSVMLASLVGQYTREQIAKRCKVNERTVQRIWGDAVKVGFGLYTGRDGKVMLMFEGR